jgi:hypothetical protein
MLTTQCLMASSRHRFDLRAVLAAVSELRPGRFSGRAAESPQSSSPRLQVAQLDIWGSKV